VDRFSLDLPAGQEELIERVAAVNKKVVVVLQGGSPFLGGRWVSKARAVVAAWFPGEQGGEALAQILLGRVNPSGRTPVTWPKRWEDSSAFGRYPGDGQSVDYSEGLYVGYRWFDKNKLAPLFPFGHGLSYTTFAYSNLSATPTEVSFDLKNTGTRAGAEVAQLYLAARDSKIDRPERELKGFSRVELEPGQTKRVNVPLDERAFSYYDPVVHEWTRAPGRYVARVGASSRDIRLEKELELKP
jgi:beta-glucosidase